MSVSILAFALAAATATAAAPPIPPTASYAQSQSEASVLEVLDVDTGVRHVVYATPDHIEAPNWSRGGKALIFNSKGRLYRIPVEGGEPVAIDTGDAQKLNNDHGLSPDGRRVAMSDQSDGVSKVKVSSLAGGEPATLTPVGPSYFHGWSPDGATLAFVGERDGNFDIYAIPADGGPERRLTTDPAPDDGPDYAPDGRIYFNSARSGRMQIWRMNPDGSAQTRITTDDAYADWFPHPSPDGKRMAMLSYDGAVQGHPGSLTVSLRLMRLDQPDTPHTLLTLYGGQGTINVNSWAPDSRRLAFVRYIPATSP